MKLNRALICVECDEVMEAPVQACPSCGGAVLFPLAKWIDAPVIDVEAEIRKQYHYHHE